MKIAALISGGVDSSVVVHLLKEAGHDPALFYIRIGSDEDNATGCTSEEDIELSRLVARKYGCSFEIVDLHREYWDGVVAYTLDKVRRGLTPNPDVMCNKLVKFGCFEEKVGKEFEKTATGHYATTTALDGLTWLSTAKDPVKDQTDFLAQIDYGQLSKLVFPVGHLMKSEVRALAQTNGLATARRKDSQGICFLGKIDYNDFLRRYLGEQEGEVIEYGTGRKIGRHKGFWFHTIGQRHGLGFGGGPWYVVAKDPEQNLIYVSKGFDTADQYGDRFCMKDFHFLTKNPWKDGEPVPVTFKIRHTPEFIPGELRLENGKYQVRSSRKIQGIAPGQFGVVYDAQHRLCIGSGEITVQDGE